MLNLGGIFIYNVVFFNANLFFPFSWIFGRLRDHFENIQMIGDTMTLPHSISYLSSHVAEELDLSIITERLMQAKGQPSSLTSSEKLELWERLKVSSTCLDNFRLKEVLL